LQMLQFWTQPKFEIWKQQWWNTLTPWSKSKWVIAIFLGISFCSSPFALDASLACLLLVQGHSTKLNWNKKLTDFCKLALLQLELSILLISFG
jgi:hypothetical protein